MKTRMTGTVGLLVGGIGAVGQSWLLYNELAESYPYKLMFSPPPEYYANTGLAGFYLAPTVALVFAAILAWHRSWAGWVVPVLLCPALFASLFLVRDALWSGPPKRNFDGTTQFDVAVNFGIYAVELAVAGAFIGLIGWAVWSNLVERYPSR